MRGKGVVGGVRITFTSSCVATPFLDSKIAREPMMTEKDANQVRLMYGSLQTWND